VLRLILPPTRRTHNFFILHRTFIPSDNDLHTHTSISTSITTSSTTAASCVLPWSNSLALIPHSYHSSYSARVATSSQSSCLPATTPQPAAPLQPALHKTMLRHTALQDPRRRRSTLTTLKSTAKSSPAHRVAPTMAGKSLTPCHLHLASLTDLLSVSTWTAT
jgi:hypothetical protein